MFSYVSRTDDTKGLKGTLSDVKKRRSEIGSMEYVVFPWL